MKGMALPRCLMARAALCRVGRARPFLCSLREGKPAFQSIMSRAERPDVLLALIKLSRVTEVPPLSQTRNILFLACADPKSAEFKNRLLTVYPHRSMVL